jgi:hypothetical protein
MIALWGLPLALAMIGPTLRGKPIAGLKGQPITRLSA